MPYTVRYGIVLVLLWFLQPLAVGAESTEYLKKYPSLQAAVQQARAQVQSTATEHKLLTVATEGAAQSNFGGSVSVQGDTVVVGAVGDDSGSNLDQGAAYVFIKSGSSWQQQQKLTALDGDAGDYFGAAVAISGDTLVVGAFREDQAQGAVYVFVRRGQTWSQQQKLIASNGEAGDRFGSAVALSGETVVIGAERDRIGDNLDQGSAYVFIRNGTTWSQQQQLTVSDGEAADYLGISVALSGETVVLGAGGDDVGDNLDQGSAHVFVRSGTTWSQQQQLTGSDSKAADSFGQAVAISGETVVVGAAGDDVGDDNAQGSIYVFVRNEQTWSQQRKLIASDGLAGDAFGNAVAVSDDTVVVGAPGSDNGSNLDQGSIYVFLRSDNIWSLQQKLIAADGEATDNLGNSVALSADTLVTGAFRGDLGSNLDQGSTYVFTRDGSIWQQQQKLTAGDGTTYDYFGASIAVSGDTAVVGAFGDSNYRGSVYVFVKTGDTWIQQQKLVPSDGQAFDYFGYTVAIDGNTLVVGAQGDDSGDNLEQGSAYIFVRDGNTWSQQSKLTINDGEAADYFGYAVALSGDTVVVGAYAENNAQGSAYVFVREETTWNFQQQLTASDGKIADSFGVSVAISDDTLIVGAYSDDVGSELEQGSAYIFARDGSTWRQQKKLTASDGGAADYFGYAVAISGDIVVVGAYGAAGGRNLEQGSAYVFSRSGLTWQQQQELTVDGAALDNFGSAVAIADNTIVVGAYAEASYRGSAYVFVRDAASWSLQQQLTASDGAASDYFGVSVAISGDLVAVGASGQDTAQGSAYIYQLPTGPTLTDFTPSTASIGTPVMLKGTHLTAVSSVTLNAVAVPFTVNSDTQLILTVPPGAITGTLTVITPSGTAATVDPLIVRPFAVRVAQWQMAGAADFNGDGKDDLLWRNYTTGVNEIWLMNGPSYLSTASLPPETSLDWQLVGAADFTADAKPDLLWRNYNTGENRVWQLDGTTYGTTRPIAPVLDAHWQLTGAADLTGDNQPDLLWRNYQTGENAVWQMDGYTYITAFLIGAVTDPAWQLVGSGEFTNDRDPDLLWRNYTSGENAVWQMDGYTYVTAFLIGAVTDPAWQMVGAGKLTGDGSDLLWSYTTNGDHFLWEMNGYTYVGAFSLGNRPVN
ncbi:FG-GAP-like repeat-containing protein [Candidatus Cyanaurora vandensis]|uniref:FG-GAP-like repeat-containing protein n=1 Tax=Candidatus Cyanaurora vandensis TaxID=2714958 RepID=UPI00257FA464|nr:FG-GAP-like repeat-containing protein [Candidatus Cyanaurora vandensis]